MPKPENINSRNIKFLDIQDHNGGFETFFKYLNKWYNVSHDGGSILELGKSSFKHIDKIISDIRDNPKRFRIFEPDKENKFYNTGVPPGVDYVLYNTTMGNAIFYYGEDDVVKVTARQIAQNYVKLRRKI